MDMSLLHGAPFMTKEHPRIDQFLNELAGSHGLNLRARCRLNSAHFGRCEGEADRPRVKLILSRMGFGVHQVTQSMRYFDARKLACDCSVFLEILNVEGAYGSQLSQYRGALDRPAKGAFFCLETLRSKFDAAWLSSLFR